MDDRRPGDGGEVMLSVGNSRLGRRFAAGVAGFVRLHPAAEVGVAANLRPPPVTVVELGGVDGEADSVGVGREVRRRY
jgi:hypothetical protein